MTLDILVTGGAGQVGIELGRAAWPDTVRLHAPDRAILDLADPDSLARVMGERRWAAVVNCGAYTAVDKAESEVRAAWAANALAPAVLGQLTAERGIPLVHVSTDYVFDGSKTEPYREDDPVAPINVYGASKEGGEQAVRTTNSRHVIVRTAWVVSPHRANFLRTMLRLGAQRGEVRVVDDQRGCPTFAIDLAAALQTVALAMIEAEAAPTGTFHMVNGGEATWAEFARAIFAESSRRGGPSARVAPITTAEYPTPARRPTNSRMATAKLTDSYGIVPRPWPDALSGAMAELMR